ncbi:hypothetical protein EB796_007768 [Bugula neritina]|uniref:ZU5 domain-containing protein n=1 Tax=Bugula neritina TaxID=10212 RepID=A0A7J7K6Q6_BUGNE|nr:hypothetical protein EB796_007768 [Bugula neritina]
MGLRLIATSPEFRKTVHKPCHCEETSSSIYSYTLTATIAALRMSSRVQDLLTELHTSAVSNFTTDILLPNPTIGQAPSETVNEVSPKVIGAVIGGAVGCVLVLAIIIHLLLQKKKHPSAHLRSKQLKQDVYTISGESGKESGQWMPQLCEEGIHMPIKSTLQPANYDLKDSKNNKRSGARLSSLGTVPSDTVSQYLAPPTLEGCDVMTRGTPSRRSRSLENIPVNQRRSAANKSATMASQDSGFVSANSIATSPVSPSSIKEYPWQPNQHPSTTRIVQARELIAYAIEKFYSMPDRQVGKCYASSIFAIGEFDVDGGRLYLAGDMSVSLTIPAGAVKTTQLVYLLMSYDNNESGDHTENFSPTIECGPDGLQFEKPVVLTMPHAAINMELETLACEGGSAEWTVDSSETGPTVIHSSGETVSISIHHFTGFKMSRIPVRSRGVGSSTPLASQGKKLSFRVYTCGDKARIYFVCKPSSSNMSTRIIMNLFCSLYFYEVVLQIIIIMNSFCMQIIIIMDLFCR